jgi:signal transduction histidine kinase
VIKTLYGKLSVLLLAIFLVIGVFYVLLMLFVTKMHMQEGAQRLNYGLAEYLVSEKLFLEEGRVNEAALKESFHMLMEINPAIELYLLNLEGTIMAYSAPPEKVKRKVVATGPIERFLGGSGALPVLGDDPRNPRGRKVFSAAAVPAHGPAEGYLYIILGGEEFDSAAGLFKESYMLRLSIGGALAGLVFALLAGIFLFGLLTRRLHRLAGEMEAFQASDFREPAMLPLTRKGEKGDEIEKLEAIFVQMSTRIMEQLESILRSDSLRRELVSHVSHDLRTPLTTMQGYLETLEAQEGAVHREPFRLDELIQDVVQKFRLRAEEEGVGIHTDAGHELPFVYADIALIERVIENLLDNALRYTPEDGSVTVSLQREEDAVSVRVSDTGAGIPRDELPGIFDGFHQRDSGRTDSSGHAGLGLAITRRILELHGSDITVESTVDEGTTFTFSLPVHRPDG